MRIPILAAAIFGWAAIFVAILTPRVSAQPGSTPFAPGETLTFDVTWSVFPAGQVTATLARAEGHVPDLYEVTTTARSQGFVSVLYPVDNEFHSLFNPQTLCSIQIQKKINEGRRHRDTRIIFDPQKKLAILDERDPRDSNAPPKHAENEIPECVLDVVTAFYYVRNQPMRVGGQIRLPINDGAKTYDVSVDVQAREQIDTPLGRRAAFRVEPKVFRGLYKRPGKMLIWFSDDEQRLPLRIKASVSMGTITGTLKSFSPAPPGATPAR
ncbi:MAG: DUF3108 domain-containing protein [Terriglobia bacterium]